MAGTLRASSMLPSIKCSTCGDEIEIASLADHICSTPKPLSKAATAPTFGAETEINADEVDNFLRDSRIQRSLSSPRDSNPKSPGYLRPGRNPPPRIDAAAANRPYLQVEQLHTPASFYSSNSDGRSLPVTPSTQITTPSSFQSRHQPGISRTPTPPSPHESDYFGHGSFGGLAKSPSAFSLSSQGQGMLGERRPSDYMMAPVSPRMNGGANVMKRMDNIAPGPFTQGRSLEVAGVHQRDVSTSSRASSRDQRQPLEQRPLEQRRPSTSDRRPSTAHSQRSQKSQNRSPEQRRHNKSPEQRRSPPARPPRPDENVDRFLEALQSDTERSPVFNTNFQFNSSRDERHHNLSDPAVHPPRAELLPQQTNSQSRAPSPTASYASFGSGYMNGRTNSRPTTPQDASYVPFSYKQAGDKPLVPAEALIPSPNGMANTGIDLHFGMSGSSLDSRQAEPKLPQVDADGFMPPRAAWNADRPSTSNGETKRAPNEMRRPSLPGKSVSPPRKTHSAKDSNASSNYSRSLRSSPSKISNGSKSSQSSVGSAKLDEKPMQPEPPITEVFTPPRSVGMGAYFHPQESPLDPAIQQGMFVRLPPQDQRRPSADSRAPMERAVPAPSAPPAPAAPLAAPVLPREWETRAKSPAPAPTSRGKCRGCGEGITGKSVKAADGRLPGRYHKQCFVCTTCRAPFLTSEFYVHNNAPYCAHHYHEANGSLCRRCNHGIEGAYLETDRRERFHTACFACATCGIKLDGGEYFEVAGRPLCERHAFARAPSPGPGRGGYGPRGRGGPWLGPPPGVGRPEKRRTRLMMM
ncbi:hypothetical protein EJ06DRAFT_170680 [Trichodelitschia bisporula]|uniref:LIM-domain-containing protein n=1 Tax=Trichodelitschia bisporula TaxID=703511 RepID=A0A6G1HL83_9PEZI|nr:hypothetical protein EJ06DRAFT_170680 [Trichodelitschia bisporula]